MDELLEKFLEDQKMKIAEEKACLEQDPPYIEIRRRKGHILQKENIRPITSQQDGVSLPLGEEYERKKHKLQEELRKDYRKYMSEKDHWGAGDAQTVPERRLSRAVRVRDVATLTEVCGLGWGVCSSEEDCSDEELILLQGRRLQRERDTRTVNRGGFYTETSHHTSKLQYRNRTSASIATQANERSGSVASQDTVCTTGLLVGAADLEATLQRRKEQYRCELEEQIIEKQRHRRREKELDLKVAGTGVMDSERKQLFVSEASGYRRVNEMNRKLPRDDIIRLDTAEPAESLLQYKTDPLSPCRTFVPSHLPSLAEVYKSPRNDAENSLSPSTAYGPIAGPLPTSSGETCLLSPHNEPRRNTYRLRFLSENEGVASGLPAFPMHQTQTDRLSYKEELRKQIEERATRRRAEREERRRLEAEMEADMRAYEPWGRGGAGAPIRDSTGNLITDLKQMHLLNATAAVQRPERPGFAQAHSPQLMKGSVLTNQLLSPQQHLEQDQYKAYLRHQMEEKRRKQAEERERQRAEEEKEERRLAEQREKIRREYEEELENRRRREMEQKMKNEELARLAEERRREAEKKKKEEEEKEKAALKKQEDQERRIQLQQVEREPSPPIPTLQNKHRSPPHATDLPVSLAPPSSGNRNHLRTERDRSEVVNELCALSRRLRSEQRRLEEQLFQRDWDHLPSPLSDRRRVDVFDMARLRMPVRGPSSRGVEPISLKENDDIMYRDVLMPLSRTQQFRYRDVEGGRGSVLPSESEFIDQNGVAFPVPPDVERKSNRLSARERRRFANLQSAADRQQVQQVQQQTFNMRKLRDTNTLKMKQLQSLRDHDITAGCCCDEDKDEAGQCDERFNLQCPGRPSFIDTPTTEPWVRAESSDTLRRLMSGSEL